LVIDYRRFFADGGKVPETKLVVAPTEDRRGAMGSSATDVAPAGEGGMATVRALTDRVNRLESQVTDLLDIVKRLTSSLDEARKALAAKDEEIRTLQSAPGAPK
jgi:hypothetical protein